MDELTTSEFAYWLRNMADWIEKLKRDHGSEFDTTQALHEWVDELLSLR